MLILILFSLVYSQVQDEKQLTNIACVILSRYYLQSIQNTSGKILQDMVQQQGLTYEDAAQFCVASLVEQCLENISTKETMEIIQQLQTQKINLEGNKHLVENADLNKYASKKKSAKKTEILKIIKSIEEMFNQQNKDYEGGSDQSEAGKKRQRTKSKSQELPDLSIFELKEWLVLSSFVLVGVLLSYIICCIPEKSVKVKKETKKVVANEEDEDSPSQRIQEQSESSENEITPQETTENQDKQKKE